jgi:hypothetical protein
MTSISGKPSLAIHSSCFVAVEHHRFRSGIGCVFCRVFLLVAYITARTTFWAARRRYSVVGAVGTAGIILGLGTGCSWELLSAPIMWHHLNSILVSVFSHMTLSVQIIRNLYAAIERRS